MALAQWFKERQLEMERLTADALHMQDCYGSSALEMCEFAIKSAEDGGLREKLKIVRRILVQHTRGLQTKGDDPVTRPGEI